MNGETFPLPVAQRDQEISEQDFQTLIRIAEDPQAPAGRLKRVPRKIPVRTRETIRPSLPHRTASTDGG
jgi:hypothetical protein